MKKTYLLCTPDGLEIAGTKRGIYEYIHSKNLDMMRYNRVRDLNVWSISYDARSYDYEWQYGELRFYRKGKEDDYIEYDDYEKHNIKPREMKKDFLYYKRFN